jgi:DNA-binding NtrC family response regulator
MSSHAQAKMLRLLQEGTFERLGGSEPISTDVRIIAATNQNLDELIEQGKFRSDLYYRLRGVTIHLPPLSERREDIAELAHYFLFRFNKQLGTAVQSISSEAMELLERYDWPGNVRELQNVIREALIVSAYAWRRRLKEGTDSVMRPPVAGRGRSEPRKTREFIPLRLVDAPTAWEVVHPHGYRVSVSGEIHAATLQCILRVFDERLHGGSR